MTDNALRIIRELARTQTVSINSRILESEDSNESLMSYEREILDDCMPPTDDERLNRVLQEEAKRYHHNEQLN
jgi:hypothetical protein